MRRSCLLFVASLLLLTVRPALADTVHLKNGRTIETREARVVGDNLVFYQYGGEVVIPMRLVDRVEEDQATGPEASPTPDPGTDAVEDEESDEGEEAEGEEGEGEEEEVPEQQTRAYWQERLRTIHQEMTELENRLEELRREERAFLFSHRSTADVKREIGAVQERMAELEKRLEALREEARREGIPPGWLRRPR